MIRVQHLLKNHLLLSGFYKALSGLAMFFSISILLSYLGESDYGVWVLIFTLFQWILLMDFGLSSVLKTKIPQFSIEGRTEEVNTLILDTYKYICIIAVIIFILFSIVIYTVNLQELFNIKHSVNYIQNLFLLNVFFFCINFIANTHKSLFVSTLRGKFAEQSIAVNQILFLIFTYLASIFISDYENETKLLIISLVNGVVCFIINLIYTIYFFKTDIYKLFTFKRAVKTESYKSIYTLGLKYMLSQLALVFLFSSDGYILAYFYSPGEIVPYEIVTKYFQFPLMILVAAMAPLWSLFTKHYLEKDKAWLERALRIFNLSFLGISLLIIFFAVACPFVISIWIHKDTPVSTLLIGVIALTIAMRIYTFFYIYFFSGIGQMRNYLILLAVSVFMKIPLSYLFIKLNLGLTSVALASSVFLFLWFIVFPLQAKKIITSLPKLNHH